ncbi:MAG TPA: hypothetical protein DCZ10_10765 [Pelotomaculum sp.]|nr:hypothetical protein [Pelotomaculum sp.]
MFKKCISKILISVFVLSIFLIGYQFKSNSYAAEISLEAANQLNNINIEHIKIVSSNGSYTEHWRDLKNLEERTDTYDKNGTLINSIIVKEFGERIISIGYDDDQITGFTWVLPKKVASLNRQLLKKSLLEDVKNELDGSKWQYCGKDKVNGKEVKKITTSHGDTTTIIYVDQLTGYPVKREIHKNEKGNLTLMVDTVEEYQKISDESGNIFECENVELKEITSPGIDGDVNPGVG